MPQRWRAIGDLTTKSPAPVGNLSPDGQKPSETREGGAVSGDDGALADCATPPLQSPVVASITQAWRLRQRWHRAEKSLILQGKAACRSFTRGDKDEANKLFDTAAGGKDVDPAVAHFLHPYLEAIPIFAAPRAKTEKGLRELARSTPLWSWAGEIKGFGDLNLAALIGECGEIGTYRNPSCLWKRMGLAVIGEERQAKKTDPDLALLHGYDPSRRAIAWNLGECLIKASNPTYKPIYDTRKAYEVDRGIVLIHAHKRAARYMVKRLLKDMWIAARRLAHDG